MIHFWKFLQLRNLYLLPLVIVAITNMISPLLLSISPLIILAVMSLKLSDKDWNEFKKSMGSFVFDACNELGLGINEMSYGVTTHYEIVNDSHEDVHVMGLRLRSDSDVDEFIIVETNESIKLTNLYAKTSIILNMNSEAIQLLSSPEGIIKKHGFIITIENKSEIADPKKHSIVTNCKMTIESDPHYLVRVKYWNDEDLHLAAVIRNKGAVKNVTETLSNVKYFLTPGGYMIDHKHNDAGETKDGYTYTVEQLSFNELIVKVNKINK